ncbi:MAG: ATP-binding protein [Ectobacillus sp.]
MLAEKLLLHVLIILAPVFVYSALLEQRRLSQPQYVWGAFYGIAAFLCMNFPFYSYGFFWDLRFVPLILAILYGGPIATGIVAIVIIEMRTYIGGDAMVYGHVVMVMVGALPLLFHRKISKLRPKQRIAVTALLGLWPAFLTYCALLLYMYLQGSMVHSLDALANAFIIGIIQATGIAIAAKLNEEMIERKQLKQEIQRTEQLNTLGELAASIAHEVRNPLTVVKGFLQLLQQEKSHQYIPLVMSELERAESIINDYLNFAKPQLTKISSFSLSEVIVDVMALLKPLAAKQGVRLQQNFTATPVLETDRNQLKQALLNLVKNAIEATEAGGSVTVQLKMEHNHALILIQDTGKGMTKEQLSRIGTSFYTTKSKGTGLGTMVSLRIFETMNGKVSYKSEVGAGTEVMIMLPITQILEKNALIL